MWYLKRFFFSNMITDLNKKRDENRIAWVADIGNEFIGGENWTEFDYAYVFFYYFIFSEVNFSFRKCLFFVLCKKFASYLKVWIL